MGVGACLMFVEKIDVDERCSSEAYGSAEDNRGLLTDLYLQHRDSLYRVCQRRLGPYASRDDAAELVQDAFCRLARKADLHTVENPKAFLFRTVINLAKTRRRDQFNRAELLHVDISSVAEAELVSPEATPERVVRGRQDLAVLQDTLERLSPKCQAVFALRIFKGMSHKAIAEQLGMTSKAVERQLHKAVTRMAESLAADDERDAVLVQAAE